MLSLLQSVQIKFLVEVWHGIRLSLEFIVDKDKSINRTGKTNVPLAFNVCSIYEKICYSHSCSISQNKILSYTIHKCTHH